MFKFLIGLILGILLANACSAEEENTTGRQPRIVSALHYAQPCTNTSLREPLREQITVALVKLRLTRWEWGGMVIVDSRGKFCVSPPVTSAEPYAMSYFPNIPRGTRAYAIYHTHPGSGPGAQRFSLTDVQSMCHFKAASFMVTEDGVVRRLDPDPVLCDPKRQDGATGRVVDVLQVQP